MLQLISFLSLSSIFLIGPVSEPTCTADNFHKVSNGLYRSAQPSKKNIRELEEMGVYTVINLRKRMSDKQEVKGTKVEEKRIKIKTKKLKYSQMVDAMKALANAGGPVLVHCRRGSDRTGCFVACYRILYQGWSKEDAIEEFLSDELGYYKKLFPNLLEFVEDLDVEQFKADVFGY